MNIKLKEIVNSETVLVRLLRARPAKAKDTFRLAQLKRVLVPIFEDYATARMNLLEQHARPIEKAPGQYEFTKLNDAGEPIFDENNEKQRDEKAIEAFETGHAGLVEEKVEIPLKPLTLTNIDSLELDPPLSVDEMENIMYLLKGE